jgi:uncharacterized protein YebE (UPF0316 family)
MRTTFFALLALLGSAGMLGYYLWGVESMRDERILTAAWGFCVGVWLCMTSASLAARNYSWVRITIQEVDESELPPELRRHFE